MWSGDDVKDANQINQSGQNGSVSNGKPYYFWNNEEETSINAALSDGDSHFKDLSTPQSRRTSKTMLQNGRSYEPPADDNMAEYNNNLESYQRNKSRQVSQIHFDQTDEVERVATPQKKYTEHGYNSRYPPIVGYTGHISHMQDTVGQGYKNAAMSAMGVNEAEEEDYNRKERNRIFEEDANIDRNAEYNMGTLKEVTDHFHGQRESNNAFEERCEEKVTLNGKKQFDISIEKENEQLAVPNVASVEEFRNTIRTGRRMFYQN